MTSRASTRSQAVRANGGGGRVTTLLLAAASLTLATLAALTLAAAPADAAFPGTNGRIACSGALHSPTGFPDPLPGGQSRLEIFDILPNATGERRLQFNTTSDFNPRYSADGSKIAFVKDNQIWTMNADGTNEVGPLTSLGTQTFVGGWSPDGTQIVFQSNRTGNFEVFKMDADGSNQTNLTNNATPGANSDSQPAWGPDGRISFTSNRLGNSNIHIMNSDGSNVTALTADSAAEESASTWFPNGQQIAFQSDRAVFPRAGARNLEIYRINSDGSGTATRLTFNDFDPAGGATASNLTGFDLNPAVSPDGTRIVFHSGRAPEFRDSGSAGIYGQWEAYHIDAVNGENPVTGSAPVRLTNRPGNDERCDWQPIRPAQAGPGGTAYPTPYPTPPGGGVAFAGCPSATSNLIQGTPGNDNRNGTPAGDRIFAGTGNDVIDGLAGNDCIDLGPGNDRGQGGLGDDLVLGGLGNDRVDGSSGNDTLRGNSGNDRVTGGFGNDRLHGVAGRDRVSGSRGRDRINGGSGNDVISGGSSGDRIAGDQGSDRINGNSGNDRIAGNSGNDRIRGSSGRDRISAGSGRDRIAVRDGQRDRINCGRGRDRVSADQIDVVSRNCEVVSRSAASAATAAAGSVGLPALVGGAYVALLGWRRRR